MQPIRNILVPVDFSKSSQRTMHLGAVLALKFGARLTAAHIIPSFTAFNYAFPGDTYEFERKAFAEARKRLPLELPEEMREQLNIQFIVKSGDVQDELLGIVNDENVDLVVLGTHGRRNLGRFFLGSTTETLLRRIPVPILTVSAHGENENAQSPFDAPFHRVLYATDLSDTGSSGLHYCADFARALGAHLTLLHVMDEREPTSFIDEQTAHATLMGRLHKAIEKENHGDLHAVTEVVTGVPHREILKFAETSNTDLIVMNLHGKGFLDRVLVGSTAERVIRSAKIPVLSIPVVAPVGTIPATTAEMLLC